MSYDHTESLIAAGWVDPNVIEGRITCPRCNGAGEWVTVENSEDENGRPTSHAVFHTCVVCFGMGLIEVEKYYRMKRVFYSEDKHNF